MGSSTSKRRKGHDKPHHLPKVGSPANERWEHETHTKVQFGSPVAKVLVIVLLVGVLVGLLVLTI